MEELTISINFSDKHLKRLFDKGLSEEEILIRSIERDFVSKRPRRRDRIVDLYKSYFRNKLLFNFENPVVRKQTKEEFFSYWKKYNNIFNEAYIAQLWDQIAKEVYLYN